MANRKSLVIDAGRVKQIPDADTLVVGAGIDQAAASALTIGGSTASQVTLGSASINTTVAGNLTVNGTETVVGTTTFQGNTSIGDEATDTLSIVAGVNSDIDFAQGAAREISLQAASSETASSALSITGGAGGAAAGSAAGGAGGALTLSGGAGGAGDASNAGGAGANLTLNAGAGGADGGAGAGADGSLLLGAANTASIQIGNSSDNPNFQFLGSGELQFGGSAGTSGYVLTSNGAGSNPTWQAIPSATTTLQDAYNNDTDGGNVTVTMNSTDGKIIWAGDQDMQWTTSGTADFDSAADFSGGLTNSAGELLVSGGNMQLNDSIVLSFGTDDDLTIVHNGVSAAMTNGTGIMVFEQNDPTSNMAFRLADAGGGTKFIFQDSLNATVASIDSDGNAVFVGGTFSGLVDAQAGLDVSGAALTSAAGTTHSGGELLVSGGNMQLNDDIVMSFGTDDDATVEWDSTNSALVIDNTSATGQTVLQLGTDNSASAVQIKNNSASVLFSVDGGGTMTHSGSQATFAGNVDVSNGLDISGGAMTMTGSNIDLDPTGTFALDMDASQTATITLSDNLADALLIQEGVNAYLDITTTDSSEKMEFGNATTNPNYEFLGTGLVDMANGSADLPDGTSISFGGTTGSANLTGANLNELVDGGETTLHSHPSSAATQLEVSGQTTTGFADGDFGYISANNTWTKTDATAAASSVVAGVNEGTSGTMTLPGGVIENAKFTTDGGSPSAGQEVYLAEGTDDTNTGAGKLTATAPTTAGSFVAPVGICLDNSNYAGSKTAKVLFMPKAVVAL